MDPASEQTVRLRDGGRILVRAVRPEDKAGILGGFRRMSPTSRYRRFLTAAPSLGERTLAYLTEIDHRDHEALVAIDPDTREGLGVARYVRSADRADEAEAAIAVVDDWHRRGVGTVLLERLTARARREGIRRFTAVALAENEPVLALVRHAGPAEATPIGGGAIELRIELPPRHGPGETLTGLLRAAGRGLVRFRPVREPARR